jgi:hypothetical protein
LCSYSCGHMACLQCTRRYLKNKGIIVIKHKIKLCFINKNNLCLSSLSLCYERVRGYCMYVFILVYVLRTEK